MTDLDIETRVRRGLDRWAEAMVVTPPPLEELVDRPADRRHRMVLAAAGMAAAAAVATGALILAGGVLGQDDHRPGRHDVATSPPGDCDAARADGDVVTVGVLPDGRRWSVETRAAPPRLELWGRVAGEDVGGYQHNVWSWSGLINDGTLSWQLDVFDDGHLLFGELPPSASTVTVHLEGGRLFTLCPVAVPGLDAVRFAGTALPADRDILEVVAVDATGRTIARQDVTSVLPPVLTESGGYGFYIDVDARLVELPLGGVAADDPATAPTQPVVTGELPSGPWSLRTGVVGDPPEADYVVELALPPPHQGMTVAARAEDHRRNGEWHASSLDGRLVVWGVTASDVAELVVALDDGRTVPIPTQPSGMDGFDVRVFAGALPEGALPAAIEGRSGDGGAVVRATELSSSLRPLGGFPPGETVNLPTDQID